MPFDGDIGLFETTSASLGRPELHFHRLRRRRDGETRAQADRRAYVTLTGTDDPGECESREALDARRQAESDARWRVVLDGIEARKAAEKPVSGLRTVGKGHSKAEPQIPASEIRRINRIEMHLPRSLRGLFRSGYETVFRKAYRAAKGDAGRVATEAGLAWLKSLFRGIPFTDELIEPEQTLELGRLIVRTRRTVERLDEKARAYEREGDMDAFKRSLRLIERAKEVLALREKRQTQAIAAMHLDFSAEDTEDIAQTVKKIIAYRRWLTAQGYEPLPTSAEAEKGLRRAYTRAVVRGRELLSLRLSHGHRYVISENTSLRRSRNFGTAAWMAGQKITDGEGTVITIADAAEKTVANPAVRFAEMLCRLEGVTRLSLEAGLVPVLVTITTPSRFHRTTTVERNGQKLSFPNRNWNGAGADQASAWFNERWEKAQRTRTIKRLQASGAFFAESHQDGCPHWHGIFFVTDEDDFRALLENYFLLPDNPNETGARQRRVDLRRIEPKDPEKQMDNEGRPVPLLEQTIKICLHYASKYCQKQLDSGIAFEVDEDAILDEVTEDRMKVSEAVEKISTWKTVWAIRSWRFLNAGSATIWRELRRTAKLDPESGLYVPSDAVLSLPKGSALRRAALAACASDYTEYLRVWREKIAIIKNDEEGNERIKLRNPLETIERVIIEEREKYVKPVWDEDGVVIGGEEAKVIHEKRRIVGVRDVESGLELITRDKRWVRHTDPVQGEANLDEIMEQAEKNSVAVEQVLKQIVDASELNELNVSKIYSDWREGYSKETEATAAPLHFGCATFDLVSALRYLDSYLIDSDDFDPGSGTPGFGYETRKPPNDPPDIREMTRYAYGMAAE